MRANARDVVSAVLFAGVLWGGLRTDLFLLPFADRRLLQNELASAADRVAPEYPAFLDEVAKRTQARATIALLFRSVDERAPWWYGYFRARYFLPDRDVLSVSGMDGALHPEYLDQARYVAAWGVPFEDSRFQTVWTGQGGQLAERRR
jgi:hypothetical protein